MWPLIIAAAAFGLIASLYPNRRWGCAVLLMVPVAMLFVVHTELSEPSRRPDALDALGYLFGPLWPSLGAIAGFLMGRAARKLILSRRTRGEKEHR